MDLLSAMETFVRVVDAGSLAKVALATQTSSAWVSRQLSNLEAELGSRLLLRTTRRITVTEEGQRFYESASRTLRHAEEAREVVGNRGGVSGLLTLSMPIVVGMQASPAFFLPLLKQHPALRIDLKLEDHAVDLGSDGIDVAVRAGLRPPDHTSIVAHKLGSMPRRLVASPRYLRKAGTPSQPHELARHAVVDQLVPGRPPVWELTRGNEQVQVEVRGAFRSSSLGFLRDMCMAHAGVAMLPDFMVAHDINEGRLRELKLGGFKAKTDDFFAIHRVELRNVPRIRCLVEHAKADLMESLYRASQAGRSG